MMNRRFSLLLIGLSLSCFAGEVHLPRRISGQILDLGKVHTIYMVPGMATLVEIPTAVTGIRLGNPDAVQYYRPEKPENEVTLVLKDNFAKPTNLIIRSNAKKYVFDIVPSKEVHQDTIEVLGSYGGAAIESQGAELIESSDQKLTKSKGGSP
ncbi:MAG: hypothetical protein KGQ59_01220 [Bdellovibrionales bacterium]|nr:hypothetical protein [Bdellovibrionales bacterium]